MYLQYNRRTAGTYNMEVQHRPGSFFFGSTAVSQNSIKHKILPIITFELKINNSDLMKWND